MYKQTECSKTARAKSAVASLPVSMLLSNSHKDGVTIARQQRVCVVSRYGRRSVKHEVRVPDDPSCASVWASKTAEHWSSPG